ncbi:high choriolytic enzyme 1-like [Etheostoma cragini]|uniref:high choriolytic enzyme 1-like n=1 Tax=Etheostoma cragini TaxID=417921 RepID=UPI00155F08A2|nr:high choriolytic enzyme 1-like [Etheostoma cragini]
MVINERCSQRFISREQSTDRTDVSPQINRASARGGAGSKHLTQTTAQRQEIFGREWRGGHQQQEGEGQEDTQPITSQIFTRNEHMKDLLTDGDIFVPRTRTARNAVSCSNCAWQKLSNTVQVPYDVSTSFTSSEKITINNAISAFHMSTCVRFVPRVAQTDYISIEKLSGCWSYAGRTGGAQQLSLGAGCVQHGIVQHELIHALGFWHEQSRSDRDSYVRINYENILDGYASNFDRKETNNLAVPYDYSSVMHYAAKDFSKNGGDTITPLTPSAQIGQRASMSDSDILKINKLYDCSKYTTSLGLCGLTLVLSSR